MSATAMATGGESGKCEGYLHQWAEQIARVLEQGCGKTLVCQKAAATPSGSAGESLRLVIHHHGESGGRWAGTLCCQVKVADVIAMALAFTGEATTDPASSPSEVSNQHREALLNLFRKAGELVATAVPPEPGEIAFTVNFEDGTPGEGSNASDSESDSPARFTFALRMPESDTTLALLHLNPDATLFAALAAAPITAALGSAVTAVGTLPANLDMLRDVHLGVVLRFGQRQLPLREILAFGAGTVIELDQNVDDPVELLLDDKIIARGEVVVVDGNYGLRVTEIVATPRGGQTAP